ncbi:MAG: hypothetical protein GX364_00500 [Firmicutes bacterium]|nr:hypothetical protein [Bacillota bacterium]
MEGKELDVSREYIALMEQLSSLKTELSKLISDHDFLINTVKPNLEMKYHICIGKEQYRLYLVRNETLRIRRKIEMIQASLNRGEVPDLQKIEQKLDIELQKWKEEVLELQRKIKEAQEREKLSCLSPDDSRELRKLYRELVKRLHPDINKNLPDNLKYIWARVLEAYKNSDLEELQVLASFLPEQEESAAGASTMEQLSADIDNLRGKIERLLKTLATMRDEFPFNMEKKLGDPDWVEKEQRMIRKELKRYQLQKQTYSAFLEDLLKPDIDKKIH